MIYYITLKKENGRIKVLHTGKKLQNDSQDGKANSKGDNPNLCSNCQNASPIYCPKVRDLFSISKDYVKEINGKKVATEKEFYDYIDGCIQIVRIELPEGKKITDEDVIEQIVKYLNNGDVVKFIVTKCKNHHKIVEIKKTERTQEENDRIKLAIKNIAEMWCGEDFTRSSNKRGSFI